MELLRIWSIIFFIACVCPFSESNAYWYLTTGDQNSLLKNQTTLVFGNVQNSFPFIDVDSTQVFQSIDGFGFALTGGSAYVLNKMNPSTRSAILNELFSDPATNNKSIGISFLRLSLGSSDLNAAPFTYDEVPRGQTDVDLSHFSLSNDEQDLIPVLKEILQISPNIKLLATPWTAPTWMKSNSGFVGGNLLTKYYEVYANYFVKYIQQMQQNGIPIWAITPQNEPENPNNDPSLSMAAPEETAFVKVLGQHFQAANLKTKIIIFDHNCDHPNYPISILSDPVANALVDGSAFHLYGGDISALSTVHDKFPNKNVYFTEQATFEGGDFSGDLNWHLQNVIIGSTRNWAKTVLEWNLANDANYGPHTPGGCGTCKGGLTISGNNVQRNVGYYIVGHVSKFVPPLSTRIASNIAGRLLNVAFLTPDGNKVLVVLNSGGTTSFNVRFQGKWVTASLPANAVATFVWK